MAALTWVRLSRRFTSFIRQKELPNLEAWLDFEATRQPAYTFFILSCAIPAGIGTFGGLTVFVAWLAGNKGTPLILGSVATILLAAITWFIFFRIYQSVSPQQRKLRKLVSQFTSQYASLSNMIVGENSINEEFANLLDRAAAVYHACTSPTAANQLDYPAQITNVMEESMIKLLEVAVLRDKESEKIALSWAEPLVTELETVHKTLIEKHQQPLNYNSNDPLTNLRSIRAELESHQAAEQELDQHINNSEA